MIVIIGPWISRSFSILQLQRKQPAYYILNLMILTNSSVLSDDKHIYSEFSLTPNLDYLLQLFDSDYNFFKSANLYY